MLIISVFTLLSLAIAREEFITLDVVFYGMLIKGKINNSPIHYIYPCNEPFSVLSPFKEEICVVDIVLLNINAQEHSLLF